MSTSKTWNNTSYSIPNSAGERNWASLTDFLTGLADYAQTTNFQKMGMRVATTSPITVLAASDCILVSALTVPAAVAVTLPAGVTGQMFLIVDGTGDAQTNNITVTPTAGLINGAATYVIAKNRGAVAFAYNGTGWNVVSEFTAETSGTVTVKDSTFTIQDNADATKQLQFQVSGVTTGTTRTLTVPDASTTLVGTDATQTLTNKTIDADTNTITNIENADIKSGAAIAYSKLNLSSSIVNADVSGSAAIAYSKLNLGTSIVNADVSGSAAIAYSKLNLSGSVATADLASGLVVPADKGGTGVANNAAATTTRSGNFAKTETLTGVTSVTYPTSGTLATLGGTETFTGAKTFDEALGIKQVSTPSNPSSGYNKIYTKSDGLLYKLDSAGNEVLVGSGAGAGEINLVINPNADTALDGSRTNDVGDWIDSGTGTTSSRTTTTADIPLYPLKTNAIKILNDGSSTGYTYMRMTLPTSLVTRKLKIAWEQFVSTSTAYASGDFKVEMYSNASSDYSGAYTAISLSTDVSGISSIPAANGKFQTTFDTSTATYLELRITRTAGTANSYICLNEVVVGPGIQPQGAVVGTTESVTFTGTFTNTTYTAKRTRIGEWAEYQVLMTLTGTPGAATLVLTLPSGDVIDTTALVDSASQFLPGAQVQLIDTGTAGYAGTLRVESSTTVGIYYLDDAAAAVTRTAVTQAAPYTFASTDKIDITFRVPLARYAGSGTVNVANNDVEYAYNTGTWDATDTTSFGYGPSGKIMGGALSALRTKRVRFQTPISPTDRVELELSKGGSIWLPAHGFNDGSGNPLMPSYDSTVSGNASAGVFLMMVSGSTTDIDVQFFRYIYIGNDDAPVGDWQATWYWRVKKSSGGQAVGFGNVSQSTSGLVKSAGQLLGTNTNDSAATGYVGEIQTASLSSGSANSLTTNVAENLMGSTLVLTPGQWRISGLVAFTGGASTSTTQLDVSVSKTTGTLAGSAVHGSDGEIWIQRGGTIVLTTAEWPVQIPPYDIKISSTTTLYLVVRGTFTVSTLTAYGFFQAVRVR